MSFSRRKFLIGAGAATALGLTFAGRAYLSRSSSGFLLGASGKDFVLFNLQEQTARVVSTPTLAHGFIPWPFQASCFLGVEKSGRSLSLVDFQNDKVIRSIQAMPDCHYYGHLVLAPNGDEIVSTQVHSSSGQGRLVIYDAKTLRVKESIETTVGGTHDLTFLPQNPEILVLTSSGVRHYLVQDNQAPQDGHRLEKSSVIFFDFPKRKVVQKFFLEDESLICGHIVALDRDRVGILTTMFREHEKAEKTVRGAFWVLDPKTGMREIPVTGAAAGQVNDELLSAAYDKDSQMVFVTNPVGQILLQYDVANEKFVDSFSMATNSVAIDDKRIFISEDRSHLGKFGGREIVETKKIHEISSAHSLYVSTLKV